MKIIGSHDEIVYLMTQCIKISRCDTCILKSFCDKAPKWSELFVMEEKIRSIDTILIPKSKGDDKDARQ